MAQSSRLCCFLSASLAALPFLAATIAPTAAPAASRGKLSDAVDKAKKKDSEPIPFGTQTKTRDEVPAPDPVPYQDDDYVYVEVHEPAYGYERPLPPVYGPARDSAPFPGETHMARHPMRFFVTVSGGGGGGESYASTRSIETSIGFSPMPGFRFDVSGLLSSPKFDASTGIDGAFSRIVDPAIGISARVYPEMTSSFTGLYLHGGYRYGRLQWDYTNPILVEEPSGAIETISDDRLAHHSVYGGFGLSFATVSSLRVGGNFSVGWREYGTATREHFDNDVFSTGMFAEFRVELGWIGPDF